MPWSVAMRIGPAVTTGSVPHTSTRYPGSPDGSATRPNTSTGVVRSNAMVSGSARTATVCMARRYRRSVAISWRPMPIWPLSERGAGTTASMRCGPGSAIAALKWVASSSAVVARVAGTPNPSAIATKSMSGLDRSSRDCAFGPAADAPTRISSSCRIAYAWLLRMTTVMSSCSRAMVHSAEIVYSALPSDCSAITGRCGAAMAAPTATGRPWPIAPPVSVSTSCGGDAAVASGKQQAAGVGFVGDDRVLGQQRADDRRPSCRISAARLAVRAGWPGAREHPGRRGGRRFPPAGRLSRV